MSVIIELSLPAAEFQLGTILDTEGAATITLETMVPLEGNRSVPFFRTYGDTRASFEASVRSHPAVSDLSVVSTHGEETLYALNWDYTDDSFLNLVGSADGHLLEATGDTDQWGFQLRLPSHDSLSWLQDACYDADIPIAVSKIYNPAPPEAGAWYGLTDRQRRTLREAVVRGYYSLPRQTSTKDLAETFDVSDQSVIERLLCGIRTLVTHTLLVASESEPEAD